MALGKWASNNSFILEGLEVMAAKAINRKQDDAVSTLGLQWLPSSDSFTFKPKGMLVGHEITKRIVLSEIVRLFDPLGWIAPIIVSAKIVLQDIWLLSLGWDELLPDDLQSRWTRFRSEMQQISLISLPRWLGGLEAEEWHLHGFADTSKRAYAAAIYAVYPNCSAQLLFAKTKLAPTKVQSLPRLELCGAVLAVRLAKHVSDASPIKPSRIHLWSDSRVVLDWLKTHPAHWPTFVANRTSEILSELPAATWRRVKSFDNSADCAIRGLAPSALAQFSLWWHGPVWLTQEQEK
ncbi:uncharacterized protein LOC111643689 [Copidosoma floridanum]|uniref:uncharacterized protein LOC111643689 n=1 Tax=Copidosoma floridanum TaxID=29053 RepID=UPI000C6FB2B5|nr:uncharacterized protein LOC111643689 [Copidosoma floridanum]